MFRAALALLILDRNPYFVCNALTDLLVDLPCFTRRFARDASDDCFSCECFIYFGAILLLVNICKKNNVEIIIMHILY